MKLKQTRRIVFPALLVASVLTMGLSRSVQAADITAAERLPKDVYVYFSVPNVNEFKKRWNDSSSGKLLKDKAFDEFLKDIKAQLNVVSGQAQQAVGFSLEELLTIPSGEFSVAVVKGSTPIPGVVAFLDFGKSQNMVTKLLAKADTAAKRSGASATEEKSNGVTIHVYSPPNSGDGEEGAAGNPLSQLRLAYFIKGSMLVFGTDVPALKNVLARWDGKADGSFSKAQVFSYIRKRCATDNRAPVLEWYLNPIDLIQQAITASKNVPPAAKGMFAFLPLLGVNKFRAIGGSVDLATKEFDSVSKTVVYVEQPATGLLNLFRFPAVKQTPPKWVPASASTYSALNWDFKSAYTSVESLFNMINALNGPDALGKLLQKFADDPNGPGIHLKKDVIDQLSGQIHVASEITSTDSGPQARFTVAIGMKDKKKAEELIGKITNHPTFPGKSRKVNGQNLYEIDLGATFGGNTGTMGFALTQGSLIFCSDVKQLESIMLGNNPEKSLVDSKDYQRIAKRFPAKTSMLSYSRSDAQLEAVWDQFRSGSFPLEIPGVNLSKLPPFSAVKKYLRPSGSYTIPDKNGAYMESFSLRAN
ncbi:MAG: hypothetical protein Tsb009_28820 [Planctomycetaceae bacterium]